MKTYPRVEGAKEAARLDKQEGLHLDPLKSARLKPWLDRYPGFRSNTVHVYVTAFRGPLDLSKLKPWFHDD